MKPRALARRRRGPNAAAWRLEISDDRRRVRRGRDQVGDVEAVEVAEVDVEQDDRRRERGHRLQGRVAVVGLADDREAVGLEQRARGRAEVRVVVDDEHGPAHAVIVALAARRRTVASRNRGARDAGARTGPGPLRPPWEADPPAPSVVMSSSDS